MMAMMRMPVMLLMMSVVVMCMASLATFSPVCQRNAREHYHQRNSYGIFKHLNPLEIWLQLSIRR